MHPTLHYTITWSLQIQWGVQIFAQFFWFFKQFLWAKVWNKDDLKICDDTSNTPVKKKNTFQSQIENRPESR